MLFKRLSFFALRTFHKGPPLVTPRISHTSFTPTPDTPGGYHYLLVATEEGELTEVTPPVVPTLRRPGPWRRGDPVPLTLLEDTSAGNSCCEAEVSIT